MNLIEQLEGLRKKKTNVKHFGGNGYYNQQGFNQALDQAIALVEAEQALSDTSKDTI